ncbi:MAG TPA: tRNA uridine(34) 5-carboxymethylaminomethyl modification radical SAM/GNAT enzyme Elp3 [Candidatus Bathyarchaeia archaeon]|nr:tRNA uridine(34) 5-carboxymethylaminomethyl modification radical SAM/GNAT enzyme Elp3 [Candidatus Bathyarchaeia archaeon]
MSQLSEQVSTEIIDRLATLESPSRNDVNRIKIEVCKKYSLPLVPPNSEILQFLPKDHESRLKQLLTGKLVRSVSGVITVAVMPKPWGCPHGKCTYCPGGPEVGVPRAYTGQEPAVMRALEVEYDPQRQVISRISQLRAMGHPVDKVELILIGGTFPFMPRNYQEDFVKNCLDALNGKSSATLGEAKDTAEAASVKNVGITVETRPDWSRREQVDHMLSMGVTRVEIGVQTMYDDVYMRIHRDHTVADVAEATQTLRDSCLKVGYHMMLGLPGCDHQRDLNAFRQILDDPDFKPDMLKIYPCLVTPGTQLHREWKAGSYRPYSTREAAKLIAEIKQFIPPWVRIMRIQREIPVDGIADGVMNGNLRQLVQEQLSRQGTRCRCVRCREVGQHTLRDDIPFDPDQIRLARREYRASGGTEIFLSFEETKTDILIGYLRLRIPSDKAHRLEITGANVSLVRELHVLGPTVPVGARNAQAYQHKGYGSKLLAEAERISLEEYDCKKILVISALGTKNYYRRFEYDKDGPYMSKGLAEAA